MAKKKKRSFLQAYIKTILPPYTKEDFLPVILTISLLVASTLVLKPVLAQVVDTEPPTQPIWSAMNGPVIPFIHAEQATVHLHWTSTDNMSIAGYRIYKGDYWTNVSTLAATTTTPNYSDFNGGGRNFYAIEAFDASGNVSSRSVVESTYVPADWGGCTCPDAAVISGWITNQQTGAHVTGYIDFELTSGKVKNIPATRLYYHNYASNGFYQQLFKEITTDGTYHVTLRANGFQTITKDITLKAGRSLETYWQLVPAVKKGR